MPPRCLPLCAACGENLTCSACVSRAARDDRIVRERRTSRVARRGRRRGRRRATNALGGSGATASSHDFSSSLSRMSKQLLTDRIASSDFPKFVWRSVSHGWIIRALCTLLLGDDRARIHQGRSDGTVAHSEKD